MPARSQRSPNCAAVTSNRRHSAKNDQIQITLQANKLHLVALI